MVAVDRLEAGLQILIERQIEEGVHDALVLLLGDLLDALALEVPVLPLRRHEHLDEVPAPVEQAAGAAAPVGHPAFLRDRALDRLGRHRLADLRVAEGAHPLLIGQGHDLVPGRHAAEEALGMGDVLVLRHVEAALQIKDRAGDGRQARAVAARTALEPVLEPLQVLDPFVGVADRIRHQVVDRRPAGARRQFAGDLPGLLGAAGGAAGDLEHAGAEFAEHAGERPALRRHRRPRPGRRDPSARSRSRARRHASPRGSAAASPPFPRGSPRRSEAASPIT